MLPHRAVPMDHASLIPPVRPDLRGAPTPIADALDCLRTRVAEATARWQRSPELADFDRTCRLARLGELAAAL